MKTVARVIRVWSRGALCALLAGSPLVAQDSTSGRKRDTYDQWARARDETHREALARRLEREDAITSDRLRARAREAGWRSRVLLLRVLSARGDLRVTDLDGALESAAWRIRAAAARAVEFLPRRDVDAVRTRVVALAEDEHDLVRAAALEACARIGVTEPKLWRAALARNEDRDAALRFVCAEPARFAAVLREVLADSTPETAASGETDVRARVLELLDGAALSGGLERDVHGIATTKTVDDELRRFAILLMRRERWPADCVELVIAGHADGRDSADRLGQLLDRAPAGRVALAALEIEDEDHARRCMRSLERADSASRRRFLARIEELIPALWEPSLRILRQRAPGLCVEHALTRFAGGVEANLRRAIVASLGTELAKTERGVKHLADTLVEASAQGQPYLAEFSYLALVAGKHVSEPVLAYARANPKQLSKLIGLRDAIPSDFWLSAARAASTAQERWVAMSALALYEPTERIAKTVRRALRSEPSMRVRRAALSASLAVDEPVDLDGILADVVRFGIRDLDTALMTLLETSKRAWVERAMRFLAQTRLSDQLIFARAGRGDVSAARQLMTKRLETLTGAQLRRLRKGFAHSLRASDLDWVFARLIPRADAGEEDIWFRAEILEWLGMRRDLDIDIRLERWLARETDVDMRAAGRALLVRRGKVRELEESLDLWLRKPNDDNEGVLLELLGSLSKQLGEAEVEFLVDLLLVPARKEPRAVLARELDTPLFGGRVAAMYPLMNPAVRALSYARPTTVARVVEASTTKNSNVWNAMPEETWMRAMQLAARHPPSLEVAEPIVEFAYSRARRGGVARAVLSLLCARVAWNRGDDVAAERYASAGVRRVLSLDVPARVLEVIARDTLPGSSGRPRAILRGFVACLRARTATTDSDKARWNEAARLALREDSRLTKLLLR